MTKDASNPSAEPFHPPANREWLRQWDEPVIEPDLPIIDAHHHLFDRAEWRYHDEDFAADLGCGHRVKASVYLECSEAYRTSGPVALRPVGETEHVERIASRRASRSGAARMCAAIVGHADLMLGAAVDEVLQAHIAASPGRFRGIRHGIADDPDPAFVRTGVRPARAVPGSPAFREGFARLAAHGLSFDAWLYHPQLKELASLARDFPDTTIVLNHVGGPLGIGGYAGRRDAVFAEWQRSISELATFSNIHVKLGGLGMRLCGFGFHAADRPPDSAALAQAWRPYVEACIAAFGTDRCMFESNFPVDQLSCSYKVLWNAFKRIAAGCSGDEKADLFSRTAARVYRIDG